MASIILSQDSEGRETFMCKLGTMINELAEFVKDKNNVHKAIKDYVKAIQRCYENANLPAACFGNCRTKETGTQTFQNLGLQTQLESVNASKLRRQDSIQQVVTRSAVQRGTGVGGCLSEVSRSQTTPHSISKMNKEPRFYPEKTTQDDLRQHNAVVGGRKKSEKVTKGTPPPSQRAEAPESGIPLVSPNDEYIWQKVERRKKRRSKNRRPQGQIF